nr:hypothetical protein CFP56_03779 [Quercus suber]
MLTGVRWLDATRGCADQMAPVSARPSPVRVQPYASETCWHPSERVVMDSRIMMLVSELLSLGVLGDYVYNDGLGATKMMARAVQDGLLSQRVDVDTTTVQEGKPVYERPLRSDKDLADYVLNAFPAAAKLFKAFVPAKTDSYLGRALIHSGPVLESASELSLLLKYITKNNREVSGFQSNSWSIRNLGLYQKHGSATNSETAILINVSQELGLRLKNCLQGPIDSYRPYKHWTRTPLVILGTLSANWASFTTDLHEDVTSLANDSAFTNPNRPQTGDVDVQSLEQCTTLLDKLQQATYALQSNLTTLDALKGYAQKYYNSTRVNVNPIPDQMYESFLAGLDDTARELSFTKAQLELIQSRLDRTTAVIRDLIQLRSTYTVEKLTMRSMVEARTVRLIAIVSLLFIPPTFTTVSRCLLKFAQGRGHAVIAASEMQQEPVLMRVDVAQSFIQADMVHPFQQGLSQLNADHDLWFWFAITFPLMLITLGGWLYWDWRTTRNMSKEFDSKV